MSRMRLDKYLSLAGKAFRVFRVFKALRYSRSVEIIVNVLKRSKESLIAVGTLAIAYILIAALVIFNVEPDSFNSFFDAIYWAHPALTSSFSQTYPRFTTVLWTLRVTLVLSLVQARQSVHSHLPFPQISTP